MVQELRENAGSIVEVLSSLEAEDVVFDAPASTGTQSSAAQTPAR